MRTSPIRSSRSGCSHLTFDHRWLTVASAAVKQFWPDTNRTVFHHGS